MSKKGHLCDAPCPPGYAPCRLWRGHSGQHFRQFIAISITWYVSFLEGQ